MFIDFRERKWGRRERRRQREKHRCREKHWSLASHIYLDWGLIRHLGMCSDWKLNLQHFGGNWTSNQLSKAYFAIAFDSYTVYKTLVHSFVSFFLIQHFGYVTSLPSGLLFSDEKWVVNVMRVLLYMISNFSFLAFWLFSFSFSLFMMVCQDVNLFAFILLGVSWASYMCRFIYFIKYLEL